MPALLFQESSQHSLKRQASCFFPLFFANTVYRSVLTHFICFDSFAMMDADKLIADVFKRPAIWDKRRHEHANRNVLDKAWKEISNEMNVEGM